MVSATMQFPQRNGFLVPSKPHHYISLGCCAVRSRLSDAFPRKKWRNDNGIEELLGFYNERGSSVRGAYQSCLWKRLQELSAEPNVVTSEGGRGRFVKTGDSCLERGKNRNQRILIDFQASQNCAYFAKQRQSKWCVCISTTEGRIEESHLNFAFTYIDLSRQKSTPVE